MKRGPLKNYFWPALVCVLLIVFILLFGKTIYLIATTNPPSPYMVKNLEKQIECAERIGFKIRRPILRVMKESPNWNETQGWAYNVRPNSLIILAPYVSHQIMAHELGHVIDYQTSRRGNPELERIKDLSIEAFADAIRYKILAECWKP